MYDALDVPRMRQEAEQKALRDERLQAFAIRVINAGFKAEALKSHPDRGGKADDMVDLQQVREALKQFAAVQWPCTNKTWP